MRFSYKISEKERREKLGRDSREKRRDGMQTILGKKMFLAYIIRFLVDQFK